MTAPTEVLFEFEGREYVAKRNHAGWKSFGPVESRSWNVYPTGPIPDTHDIVRELVLVEVKGRGFRGYSDIERAAIKAIETRAV